MPNLLTAITNIVHNGTPHHMGDVISGTCSLTHTNTYTSAQQSIGSFVFGIYRTGDPMVWKYINGSNLLCFPDPIKSITVNPGAVTVPASSVVVQDNVPFQLSIIGDFNFQNSYFGDIHSVDFDVVNIGGTDRQYWRAWPPGDGYASFLMKVTANDDMTDQYNTIVFTDSKTDWIINSWVNGTLTIRHQNIYSDNDAYSTGAFQVQVYNSSNQLLKTSPVPTYGQQQFLTPSEQKNETGIAWGIDCSNIGIGTGYYIKIVKVTNGAIVAISGTFNIIPVPSSVKTIMSFGLWKIDNPSLPEDINGTIDNVNKTITCTVPSTFDRSTAKIRFTIDSYATSNPSGDPDVQGPVDCTNPVNIRVIAGDQTYWDYTLTLINNAVSNCQVQEGVDTQIVPNDLSSGDSFDYHIKVKNLGSISSNGTDQVVVILHDLEHSFEIEIATHTVSVLSSYGSTIISGNYTPNLSIGTYYVSFYLNGNHVSVPLYITSVYVPPEDVTRGDFGLSYSDIAYNAGPYHAGDSFQGTFSINHDNTGNTEPVVSTALFDVYLIDKNNVTRQILGILSSPEVNLDPDQDFLQEDVPFGITIPTSITPDTGYWIKIRRHNPVPDVFINGTTFTIDVILSSEKKVLSYGFLQAQNTLLPANIWGIIDHVGKTISVIVPYGTNVSALIPYISLSTNATSNPPSGTAQDYSDPQPSVTHTITAQNGTTNDYTVSLTFDTTPPYLFIYDNEFTRVSPDELERGQTVKFFVLVSNSGDITSAPATMTIKFRNSTDTFVRELTDVTIPALDYNEDYLVEGEYVIPADTPLGISIDYMLTFHLNNDTFSRHLKVSNWEIASKTMVYNRNQGCFVRESIVTSKMYARINKNFYSLQPLSDLAFYLHTDQLPDGEVLLYGLPFEPSITFVVNKFGISKVFDNLIAQLNSVGVKQIEYWTEDQYSKHIWPINPLIQDQVRPYIDPEFRENKWYLPVHNEMIYKIYSTLGSQVNQSTITTVYQIDISIPSTGYIELNGIEYKYLSFTGNIFTLEFPTGITVPSGTIVTVLYDDSVNTREMRGTYLKIKITFKSRYKFALKNIITNFRQSNI